MGDERKVRIYSADTSESMRAVAAIGLVVKFDGLRDDEGKWSVGIPGAMIAHAATLEDAARSLARGLSETRERAYGG